jgi:hypothetical protein
MKRLAQGGRTKRGRDGTCNRLTGACLLLAVLAAGLGAFPAWAYYDGFEDYTNGMTFLTSTNGWQASTVQVQVQTNIVCEGTNAVMSPASTVLTNAVTPDIAAASVLWTDYRVKPPLGGAPDAGTCTSASDSLRLYFDMTGYINVDSNRTWVQCAANVMGVPVPAITTQWARVSVCVDYARSNATVFLNGELLRTNIPMPGATATNYTRVFWDNSGSQTGFLDSVSITNIWPAFETNGLTDLDDDGMLDAQEIQQYGNVSAYRRFNLLATATNVTLQAPGGGTVSPDTAFTVRPGEGTNFTAAAAAGYHVWDLLTNEVSVGAELAGRYTALAGYTNNAITTDLAIAVQFKTNPVFHVVSTNLTLGVPGGGTVAPTTNADFAVLPYTGTNFTIDANAGYHVYDVQTNGGTVGAALFGKYTAHATYTNSSITSDTTVTVQFRTNFVVTSSAGTGGSITPSGTTVAYPGTNLTFAITSSPAYVVAAITNNGTPDVSYAGQKVVSYPLDNVQANTGLQVTFSYTSNRTVGVSGDYPTLGAATAAALAGDTIQVSDGTYTLSAPVVITNRITLLGNTNSPASVWVQAPTSGTDLDCFHVRTNNVAISGFLMTGATNGAVGEPGAINAGIMVGNDTVSNQMAAVRVLTNLGTGLFLYNQFSNCAHGVYVWGATNCTVAQSEFLGNTTGVWARLTTDARSNWWGAASGPGPVGPGTGDLISSNVLTMPWWKDAARSARVIYDAAGLQATLDLAADGDVVWTTNGTYAGDITIGQAVSFLTDFAVAGQLTFNDNATLVTAVGCSNAVVAAGSTVTLDGGSLTATNLAIGAGGFVQGVNGAMLTADGLTLTGSFTADQYWATLVAVTLNFADGFESYATGTRLQAMGVYGWSATAAGVAIQTNYAASGTKAVFLPPDTEANVTVDTAASRIWTDYQCLPMLGGAPEYAATSNQSIRLTFDADGWLMVESSNGWRTCSNNVLGGVAPKASNDWVRVSVFQDYVARQGAVFLDGILLSEQVPFVGDSVTGYTKLRQINTGTESNVYVDVVSIGTNTPAGLTVDLDGDGFADAFEVQTSGNITMFPRGSVYKIR